MKLIDSDLKNSDINPLSIFIKECLIQDESSFVKLSNKDSNVESLYGSYITWAKYYRIDIFGLNKFSKLILELLIEQGWSISKQRITKGTILKGISLNKSFLTEIKNINFININSKKDIKDNIEFTLGKCLIDEKEFDN